MTCTLSPERLAACTLTLEQLAEAAWVFGLTLDVQIVPRTAPAGPATPPMSSAGPLLPGGAGWDEALAA